MKRIPICAASALAKTYGYDQVIIYARKPGNDPKTSGEWTTTYGVNSAHCEAASMIGSAIRKADETGKLELPPNLPPVRKTAVKKAKPKH